MKYQNFAVIFVLILLPISIVLSNYIKTQSDTLALETNYQTKLADSTYDAIAAYQMNSLNTQSVTGESVKSYVLASVNTFFTTLATNMGMSSASKNLLLPYIPAILFTTYDGYYIYSPTKTNVLATIPGGNDSQVNSKDAGQAITTQEGNLVFLKSSNGKERVVRGSAAGEDEVLYSDAYTISTDPATGTEIGTAKKNSEIHESKGVTTNPDPISDVDYNYMLKPFIYYSANYQSKDANNNKTDNFNFVASYTLDNYITIYGKKKLNNFRDTNQSGIDTYVTEEFSKSGYLIDPTKISINGTLLVKGLKREIDSDNGQEYSLPTSNSYDELLNSESQAHETTKYIPIDVNVNNGTGNYVEAYNLINYYNYKENAAYFGDFWISQRTRENPKTGTEPNLRMQTGDEIIKQTLEIEELISVDAIYKWLITTGTYNSIAVQYNGQTIEDLEAKEYYIKAFFFSKWVENNLSDVNLSTNTIVEQSIPASDIQNNSFAYETSHVGEIFKVEGNSENNPESGDSLIGKHKRDIIKNSIQYNLNTAISTYNTSHNGNVVADEYRLPVLKEEEWDSILNNVCMVSFMQGIPVRKPSI